MNSHPVSRPRAGTGTGRVSDRADRVEGLRMALLGSAALVALGLALTNPGVAQAASLAESGGSSDSDATVAEALLGQVAATATANAPAPAPAPAPAAPSTPIAAAPATSDASSGADIVVTGSRIAQDGYTAPTPVTVLGEQEIAAQQPANISDFVNQLPAITQSSTSANSSGSLSNGLAGIASVNLRGLGAGRTLVLIDGQRSVASSVTGIVDINTIPQDLVKRVEVVTGGASAQYGSDAVGGVVNFILDKKYTGLKFNASSGISTYGDGPNYRLSATAGISLLDDRLHMLFDVDYFKQYPVKTIARSWNKSGYFKIVNPDYTATNGQPYYLVGSGYGPYTYTAGGLVTSGPLMGTYFLGAGETGQLNYGAYNSSNSYMDGGDTDVTLAGHVGTNSLLPDENRISVFNRTSFDLTNDIELYAQISYNRYHGTSYYQQTPSTGVTIYSDNAYLLSQYPTVAAAMAANNLDSITIGTSNAGFPVPGSSNTREVYRYVGGADGQFSLFNRDWSFQTYFQHGITKSHEKLINTWNTARMALAQDAVYYNGQIVCRSTITDPDNGCVPIDRLGTDGPSAAALAYIYGDGQPQREETITQDVGSLSLNGQLFDLPGGPVAIATGAEWRREGISGSVNSAYSSGWLYGNYKVTKGSYNVKEVFVEVSLPVFTGFDIDAAGRYTDYSTSGGVGTYKFGATWQPISDFKLRGTYSHDIRAPNLSELYASGTARTNTVNLTDASPLAAGTYQFTEETVGNTDLKPERANTWTAGVVATPSFLPGFSASFDYYDIKISDAIGSVTSQNTVDDCYLLGISSFCNNITYSNGALSTITIMPVNFASQHEKGFDIAGSYRTALSAISEKLPGDFSVKADITHYISNVVDNGVYPIDYAGVNGGSLSGTYASPSWVYRVSAFYTLDPVTLNFVARGFSDGVYGNDYIECTSNCPAYSSQYATINDNHIDGAIYFDTSLAFKIRSGGHDGTLTFVVNNLANKAPVLIGNGPSGNNVPAYAQTNRSLYDVIGRTFRLALSFDM